MPLPPQAAWASGRGQRSAGVEVARPRRVCRWLCAEGCTWLPGALTLTSSIVCVGAQGTNDEMCFKFLLVYPADGVLMCMDIGKISQDEDSAKMGICIDQGNQGSLASLFAAGMGGRAPGGDAGGGAANLGSLDAFADMTMVFEAPPTNISAFVDAVCVARAAAFEASSRPTAGSASTWLLATCVTGALASCLWSLPA